MTPIFDRDDILFEVLINHHGQYSLWPAYKTLPVGWCAVGKGGPKSECLAYVEAVCSDVQSATLRIMSD
ncbi:MbtH family protein [Pseudomonas sp. FYR_11]|uniref:MbtH family protein n=1 Tax=Pseudomonas TaxID=286 RepID=UPI00370BB697